MAFLKLIFFLFSLHYYLPILYYNRPYAMKYFFQKDILRILSSFFTVFNIDGIKVDETNYFSAQISKIRLKMKAAEVALYV